MAIYPCPKVYSVSRPEASGCPAAHCLLVCLLPITLGHSTSFPPPLPRTSTSGQTTMQSSRTPPDHPFAAVVSPVADGSSCSCPALTLVSGTTGTNKLVGDASRLAQTSALFPALPSHGSSRNVRRDMRVCGSGSERPCTNLLASGGVCDM